MSETMSQKILAAHAGHSVTPGQLVVVDVDQVMVVDSIIQTVIRRLQELEATPVHPERVSVVIDHVAPASNVNVAQAHQEARRWAKANGVRIFDVGRGICHQVLIEEGLAQPGWIVLGSDSHSTTYGAVGAFGSGMGATDIALAVASGKTWLRVPETVKVELKGSLPAGVSAKDLALFVVGALGADGATYQAIEFHGGENFTRGERMTLANLTVEAGAKAGLVVPSGEIALQYQVPEWLYPDPGASYSQVLSVDLSSLEPVIAAPFAVDNVHPVGELAGKPVDMVFVGTCTNGRLEDLHEVAEILKGRQVAAGVRMLVIPASAQVLEAASRDGTLTTLIAAGATIGTPGCGPCMGRHQGVLAQGEVCVSTANRNFRGRMGDADAEIYLASPRVAAACAVAGVITSPAHFTEEVCG